MKTQKQQVMVVFSEDWADEMNMDGFDVMDKEVWEKESARIRAYDGCLGVGFGTNEDTEYRNGVEALRSYKVKNISDDDVKIVKKFVRLPYGQFPFDQLVDRVNDSDEEDSD